MLALAPMLLTGCEMALLDPKGEVGVEQRSLILTALGLMLIVVIPVFIMTIWFVWRYRASNQHATYKPALHYHHHTGDLDLANDPFIGSPSSTDFGRPTHRHSSRFAGLEMAIHLPTAGDRYGE